MKHIFYIIILSMIGIVTLAQQAITTSGNQTKNSTADLSWTIGQPFVKTAESSSFAITEGVQQIEISFSAIKHIHNENFEVSAQPNPTTYFLELNIKNENLSNLSYKLFDLHGKLIKEAEIHDQSTQIGTDDLSSGNYFIKIYQSKSILRTIQIIKK